MTRPPPEERPTPQELANGKTGEWACANCGCQDTRVVDSRYVTNDPRLNGYAKRRVRICRNCKRIVSNGSGTLEVNVPDGCRLMVVPEDERAIA